MRSISPLLFVISLVFLTAPLRGQEATNPPQTAGPGPSSTTDAAPVGHHHLLKELHLTAAQKAQIKQIKLSTPDKAQRKQQIMAVLTPEQRKQLRHLKREMKEQAQTANGQ
jgi:Spy/CpxP family protein refolding chaperone